MNPDEIKRIGEALVQNAQFISDLVYVEHELIEYADPPRSISVLKSALIALEEEDGYFAQGDNFDALIKLVRASEFQGTVSTDIDEWLDTFRNLITNYEESSLEGDIERVADYRRKMYRHTRFLVSNTRSTIKETESLVNNQFGHVKTLEAKTRETRHHIEKIKGLLNRLSKLDYKSLTSLSDDIDVANIVWGFDAKLNEQREYLRVVIQKIQKLNFSFKAMEKRTRYLNKLIDMVESSQFPSNIDEINLDDFGIPIKAPPELVGRTDALFRLYRSSSYEESKFKDIALKIKMSKVEKAPPKKDEDCYIVRTDPNESKHVDEYAEKLSEIKGEFFASINKTPVSSVMYWQSNEDVRELMGVNAWLYTAWGWLNELKRDIALANVGSLSLVVEEEFVELSQHPTFNVRQLQDVHVYTMGRAA